MIIILKQDAPEAQVREFCHELMGMGFEINDSKGRDTHILGLIGDTKAIAESWVLANPVVETVRRVSEPYKKANRKFHPDDTVVDVQGVKIGGGHFAMIAGPCSIESEEQITCCAQRVKAAGASRGNSSAPSIASRIMVTSVPHFPHDLLYYGSNVLKMQASEQEKMRKTDEIAPFPPHIEGKRRLNLRRETTRSSYRA